MVEKGWNDFKEINRVVYDPEIVTVKEMEQWLIKSGTYIETLVPTRQKNKNGGDREKLK